MASRVRKHAEPVAHHIAPDEGATVMDGQSVAQVGQFVRARHRIVQDGVVVPSGQLGTLTKIEGPGVCWVRWAGWSYLITQIVGPTRVTWADSTLAVDPADLVLCLQ